MYVEFFAFVLVKEYEKVMKLSLRTSEERVRARGRRGAVFHQESERALLLP